MAAIAIHEFSAAGGGTVLLMAVAVFGTKMKLHTGQQQHLGVRPWAQLFSTRKWHFSTVVPRDFFFTEKKTWKNVPPPALQKSLSPVTTLLETNFPDSMSDEEVLSSNFSDMLKRLYICMLFEKPTTKERK
jgi:hypothetical protein